MREVLARADLKLLLPDYEQTKHRSTNLNFRPPASLILHMQIVPFADSAPLSAKLLNHPTLKTYPGFPHWMPYDQRRSDQR
jgi:hypothetical protein